MRFIIVGAGALGSILAAQLKRAGNDVNIIARGNRASILQNDGITLRGLVDFRQSCPVITAPSTLLSTDVLILTVKTYHQSEALEQVKHIRAKSVFSVANGVQKTEQIESVFGTQHSLGCMADLSGELLQSGDVLFTRNVNLQIGALSPQFAEHAASVAMVIDAAGVNCRAVANIRSIEWSKFVPWLAFLSLSVITRLKSHQFLMDADAATVMYRITKEMHQLASHLHIELIDQSPAPALSIANASASEAIEIIRELALALRDKAPDHRMSALQDLENRRPLEVEETIGDALMKAREANIKMPTIELCYHLLSVINRNISSDN